METEIRHWVMMLSFSHFMMGFLYLLMPYLYWWSGMLTIFMGAFGIYGALYHSRMWTRVYISAAFIFFILRLVEIASDFPDEKDKLGSATVAFALVLSLMALGLGVFILFNSDGEIHQYTSFDETSHITSNIFKTGEGSGSKSRV
eukprot:TRINITY_DN2687_c0_g1_i1.p1 TRINITY_DN2687_c0_g1~~TRINITY_DN2687_c0_g1_i1.p1  ORF type:complete len:145 (-),score=26.79 TRINITY_DN2687_c0_g1_i1:44-478(-)